MVTSKTKAKAAKPALEDPKEKHLGSEDARTAQQKKFSAVVDSIAKRYGVKVASVSTPEKNPYAMSTEQAKKIALQAGIITRTGNLTRRFK